MISSKSYESCTDTRIYQIHKNIQIIILLENEAPCIKKLFHFFLFFSYTYTTNNDAKIWSCTQTITIPTKTQRISSDNTIIHIS